MDEESAESGETAAAAEPVGVAPDREDPSHNDPLGFLIDIPLRLTVELGSTNVLVGEILNLNKGSVVELDRRSDDPVDILVNGRPLARGEVTVENDRLAVRVIETLKTSKEG